MTRLTTLLAFRAAAASADDRTAELRAPLGAYGNLTRVAVAAPDAYGRALVGIEGEFAPDQHSAAARFGGSGRYRSQDMIRPRTY